jgi:hypothetical protein
MARSTLSLRELVRLAHDLGARRAAFQADWRNWHPTQSAWIAASVALSGLGSLEALQALRARIEREAPHLGRLCRATAQGWMMATSADGAPGVDRPGEHGVFGSERETPALVERMVAKVSIAEASAVAGLIASEMNRPFGLAPSVEAGHQRMAELADELHRIQTAIAATRPAWSDLVLAGDGRVLVAGSLVELLPHESLAARASDAGAESVMLALARSPAPRAA